MEKSPSEDQDQLKTHFQAAEEVLILRMEDGLRLGGGRWEKKMQEDSETACPGRGLQLPQV